MAIPDRLHLLNIALIAMFLGLIGAGVESVRAQDLCVSIDGDGKVQTGSATCTSGDSSTAVAVGQDSYAGAYFGDDHAVAVNGSNAEAGESSTAIAVNESAVDAYSNSTAIAVNTSQGRVVTDSAGVAVNGSGVFADTDTTSIAVNDSYAEARYDSRATAVNDSEAYANDAAAPEGCSVTAVNGDVATCP